MKERHVSIAFFIDANENFYMQVRGDHSKRGEKYGFWGGGIEDGETDEQALVREIKEELGLELPNYKFWETFSYQYPEKKIHLHTFICKLDKPLTEYNVEILEGDSIIEFSFEQATNDPGISDADRELIKKLFKEKPWH